MHFDEAGFDCELFKLQGSEATRPTDERALRALIDSAFAAVEPSPAAPSLRLLVQSEDGAVASGAGVFADAVRHWSDYGAAELETATGVFAQLPPQDWRFHLPAFMHGALEKLSRPIWETGLPGAVLFNLTYAADDPARARQLLDRFRCLTPTQCRAVSAFLSFVSMHPAQEPVRALDAAKALRSWWDLPEAQQPSPSASARQYRFDGRGAESRVPRSERKLARRMPQRASATS